MKKLPVGTRVKVVGSGRFTGVDALGLSGVIRHDTGYLAAVELDHDFSGGHDCGGLLDSGRGQWVDYDNLIPDKGYIMKLFYEEIQKGN